MIKDKRLQTCDVANKNSTAHLDFAIQGEIENLSILDTPRILFELCFIIQFIVQGVQKLSKTKICKQNLTAVTVRNGRKCVQKNFFYFFGPKQLAMLQKKSLNRITFDSGILMSKNNK